MTDSEGVFRITIEDRDESLHVSKEGEDLGELLGMVIDHVRPCRPLSVLAAAINWVAEGYDFCDTEKANGLELWEAASDYLKTWKEADEELTAAVLRPRGRLDR